MFYTTLFFYLFCFGFFLQHGREYRHNDTEEDQNIYMDPTELSDLWQQSWPRQRNLAKQILALRFGPIQVDKVDGNEIMITCRGATRAPPDDSFGGYRKVDMGLQEVPGGYDGCGST